MTLKVYTSVAKGLKLQVKTFWWLILHLQKLQAKNWKGKPFWSTTPIMKRVKENFKGKFFSTIPKEPIDDPCNIRSVKKIK